jgi:hypothetical protein
LGLPRTNWPEKFATSNLEQINKGLASLKSNTFKPAKVGPSLPLSHYASVYADPWYGNIEITQAKTGLFIDFKSTPRMRGALQHFQYDTFITRFEDKTIEPAYVTFALGWNGNIERVTMKAVSPIADFSYDYQDLFFTPIHK